MTFLPIVERELRIASRKAITWWSRLVGSLLALIIAACFVVVWEMTKSMAGNLGHYMFLVLSWLAFVAVCFAGIFLTSDCLSEEKREGTLGLLFLTELRGHDVVFGKLLATSLQGFYGLFAAFPILALPLLFGGVTGGDFWRVMLILVNTLFFSLACGVVVSCFSRDAQKAMGGTSLLLILFLVILPMLDGAIAAALRQPMSPMLSFFSPAFALGEVSGGQHTHFWPNVLLTHLLAWVLLGLASYYAPRVWHDKNPTGNRWISRFRLRTSKPNTRTQSAVLEKNPVEWMAGRNQWARNMFRLLLLATFLLLGGLTIANSTPIIIQMLTGSVYRFASLLALIWIASQSCRFFSEAKRTGALELLLCTPITVEDIIRGHWRGLRNLFLFPLILMACLLVLSKVSSVMAYYEAMKATTVTGGFDMSGYYVAQGIYALITLFTTSAALTWFGMWSGLSSRKPGWAITKTFLFVYALPWLGLGIVQIFSFAFFSFAARTGGGISSMWDSMWFGVALMTVFAVAKDVIFIRWSHRKLHAELRRIAAGTTGPTHLPPVIPVNQPAITTT